MPTGLSEPRPIRTRPGARRLEFQVAGQPVLTYPPPGGDALTRGRWYRITWGARLTGSGEHFAKVQPWDFNLGSYLSATDAKFCVYRGATGSLPSPGTVWVGHDGTTNSSTYLQGRLDNVSLVNYFHASRPTACTLQP